MTRYYLSFDLHNAKTEDYEELEDLLRIEFGGVEDGEQESSFKFFSVEDDLDKVRDRLRELLVPRWGENFTVCRLEDERWRRLMEQLKRMGELINYGKGE